MGAFKLTLPWHSATVIQAVTSTLLSANLAEVIVVTGHRKDEIVDVLAGTRVRSAHNPDYAVGDMLSSIQVGLRAIADRQDTMPTPGVDDAPRVQAALLCLGDQPQMEPETVQAVLVEGKRTDWRRVIIPSYRMRAGHPILIPSSLWLQIMNTTETLRFVLRSNAELLTYLTVSSPSVLADLDTPEDYTPRHVTPERRVAMRMTDLFGRTLRDAPGDAEGAGYRLLLRGGYLRPDRGHRYVYLPLGQAALARIAALLHGSSGAPIVLPAGGAEPTAVLRRARYDRRSIIQTASRRASLPRQPLRARPARAAGVRSTRRRRPESLR